MTPDELEQLLLIGHELTGVEFKGPSTRADKAFFAKVIRAALGMANLRDGGTIVVGFEEGLPIHSQVGLDSQQLATWTYDEVADGINAYADPSVRLTLEKIPCQTATYVVLRVQEFDDVPILCRKDYQVPKERNPNKRDMLRRGACYVRSRRKPETIEVPSQEDMRELLYLALEKGLRKWVTMAIRVGLIGPVVQAPPPPSDDERFERQTEDMAQ